MCLSLAVGKAIMLLYSQRKHLRAHPDAGFGAIGRPRSLSLSEDHKHPSFVNTTVGSAVGTLPGERRGYCV